MSQRLFYLVCYDIDEDRDRTWVAQRLSEFGNRVQESVFECHLAFVDIDKLMTAFDKRLDKETDEVGFYRLCQTCQSVTRTLTGHKPKGLHKFRVI